MMSSGSPGTPKGETPLPLNLQILGNPLAESYESNTKKNLTSCQLCMLLIKQIFSKIGDYFSDKSSKPETLENLISEFNETTKEDTLKKLKDKISSIALEKIEEITSEEHFEKFQKTIEKIDKTKELALTLLDEINSALSNHCNKKINLAGIIKREKRKSSLRKASFINK
jgi:uncharacterized membrane-anchored protein YjiN (DUF445 family)